jgi:hypothetical protein
MIVSSTGSNDWLPGMLLENMHNFAAWPLHVFRPDTATVEFHGKHHAMIGSYVILTTGKEDLLEQVDKLIYNMLWRNEARFLVVVTKREAIPQLLALNILRELWDNTKVLNAVVVVQVKSMLYLYTSFPYQSGKSCEVITDVFLLNKWNMNSDREMGDGTLFPDKYPRNFHGCRINVSITHPKIAEDVYIYEICKRLNITTNYICSRRNDMSVYDKITQSVKEVLFGMSEVAVGGIPLVKDICDILDPSFAYHEIKYTWYVPCAQPSSRLQRISRIFSVSVWMAVVVAIVLVALTVWCVASQSLETRAYTSISSGLYNVFAIAMGVCVTEMPRTCRLRLIIFSWISYCFAVSTVFQALFTSYLVDPGFDKQIKTLEELVESGLKFGFRPDFNVYYEYSNYWIHQEIMRRKEDCRPPSSCIQRIINTRSYATLGESYAVEKYLSTASNSSYVPVCAMNDMEAYPVKVVAYFSKQSIFLRAFNKVLMSSVEAGLVTKAVKTKFSQTVSDTVNTFFVFTVSHLWIAFYLLLLGHGLSIILFFVEVIYNKVATFNFLHI